MIVAAADEPEAVVLDLVGPAHAGRNRAADRWQTRLDEVGGAEWHAATITGASTECESAAGHRDRQLRSQRQSPIRRQPGEPDIWPGPRRMHRIDVVCADYELDPVALAA